MARGSNEHRMVFDIRGRRGVVVKIVYAILALLMVASLFLVTGALNIGSILGSASTGENAVSAFEKEAEKYEEKLEKKPGDETLLGNLTRARINTANTMLNTATKQSEVEEIKQQLAFVSEDWSEYVKATGGEPSEGLAIQAAPALFQLAELSSSTTEAVENVEAAAEAQEVVVAKQPSLNSWTYLAYYQLFTGDFKAAQESFNEAKKLAGSKFERESLENKFKEVEKNAKELAKELKAEKATKAESAGKESLENPIQGLSGTGLGGTSLGGE
jgi:DNA repair ATPase RecN